MRLNDGANVAVTGMGALAVLGAGMFFTALLWIAPWWFRVWLLAPFVLLGASVLLARKSPADTWLTLFGLMLLSAVVLFIGLVVAQAYLLIAPHFGG